MAVVLGVRGGFAHAFGAFAHVTNFSLPHIAAHMGESLGLLFRLRHYRMHTAMGASVMLGGALLAGLARVGPARRRVGLYLLGGVYVSTCLFWVLNYGAARSVYGAQLLLCATLVWLACHVMTQSPRAQQVTLAGLVLMAGLFVRHHDELLAVKDRNARVMAGVEAQWRETLRACHEPCHLVYGDLRCHLEPDWVWPPTYQPAYMAWLKQKHAPERAITLEFVQTPEQGYRAAKR